MESLDAVRMVAAEAAGPLGVELLDLVWTGGGSNRSVRVVVDGPDGVSVATCAEMSRTFDLVWEAKTGAQRDFGLEITSPGPKRTLVSDADFNRVAGRWVEFERVTEETRSHVTGRVRKSVEGVLTLDDVDEVEGASLEISLASVERARVRFVIGSPVRTERRAKRNTRR